jgi:putative restriction endonuclease
MALSGTVHWMFDRGLISVDDDYTLLIASGGVPDTVTRLINPERRLLVPTRVEERPHSQFLQYHREKVFKG